jgi:hypothetical protein
MVTNVKFVRKKQSHRDYVTIKKGNPRSRIGRKGGEQFITFGWYLENLLL